MVSLSGVAMLRRCEAFRRRTITCQNRVLMSDSVAMVLLSSIAMLGRCEAFRRAEQGEPIMREVRCWGLSVGEGALARRRNLTVRLQLSANRYVEGVVIAALVFEFGLHC